MKKELVTLTLTIILLSTSQINAQVIDSKTAVTNVDIERSEYFEFISNENKTYADLK